MDAHEQREAEERLARLELVLAAFDRRHELVDAVWDATDTDEAGRRLREMLDMVERMEPLVVLEVPIRRLTKEARDELAAEVAGLRDGFSDEVSRPSRCQLGARSSRG